ncbi:MAG: DUF86 domain-containing protein [Candidatus Lokiarchaeota archaeon]|nr:DUF86 domain-containing protein [Candidatus Lokiarchaeota archaeon]
MKKDEFLDYIDDMLDAISKIQKFLSDFDFETFSKDDKTQFAVIRALEIIGEASKKIPNHIKISYSDIPWREISGMRDKLIHDYFGVDIDVVWKTAVEDIPSVLHSLNQIKQDNE